VKKIKDINIARISTVPFFIYSQLSTQLKDIRMAGANVLIVTSPAQPYENKIKFDSEHSIVEVSISRNINIISDVKSLLSLYITFRASKLHIIHSTTPKAGLLSSIAGFLARVPVRIHTFTGQTWAEERGWRRTFFKLLDKLTIKLNHHCYADSESQKQFLVKEGVCCESELSVMGQGSLAGVDLMRFNPKRFSCSDKNELRSALDINEGSKVIVFVGRITRDKGVLELLTAFEALVAKDLNVTLLLVGPLDDELVFNDMCLTSYVSSHERIKSTGFTESPEEYLSIADVFCLPSYREGFGTVIIESAAMGLPAVASNIYGLTDAVSDGESGILVEPKSATSLVGALSLLLTDDNLRLTMGKAARERAISYFGSDMVNSLVINEYVRLLGDRHGK